MVPSLKILVKMLIIRWLLFQDQSISCQQIGKSVSSHCSVDVDLVFPLKMAIKIMTIGFQNSKLHGGITLIVLIRVHWANGKWFCGRVYFELISLTCLILLNSSSHSNCGWIWAVNWKLINQKTPSYRVCQDIVPNQWNLHVCHFLAYLFAKVVSVLFLLFLHFQPY